MKCPRCGGKHVEARCPRLWSRRRFVFLGTAAAAAVLAGPLVELAPALRPLGLEPYRALEFDGVLKEVYLPFIADQLNDCDYLLRAVTMTRAEAERKWPGACFLEVG